MRSHAERRNEISAGVGGERLLHLHAFPKGDVAFNIFSRVFGFGIVPGGVFVRLSIDRDGIIAGYAFPGTGGVGAAVLEILLVNGVGGEVVVTFDYDGAIALC